MDAQAAYLVIQHNEGKFGAGYIRFIKELVEALTGEGPAPEPEKKGGDLDMKLVGVRLVGEGGAHAEILVTDLDGNEHCVLNVWSDGTFTRDELYGAHRGIQTVKYSGGRGIDIIKDDGV